jgi:hypothetical protein
LGSLAKPKESVHLAESTTKITGVFRNGPYNGKHGEFTRFDVKGSDGRKYQTLKDGLGVKAEGLKGQTVKITYHEKQSGEYTNYEIDSLEAVGGESAPQATGRNDSDRQARIERQSARRDAIALLAAAGQLGPETDMSVVYNLADELAAYAEHGQVQPEEEPARL